MLIRLHVNKSFACECLTLKNLIINVELLKLVEKEFTSLLLAVCWTDYFLIASIFDFSALEMSLQN